MTLNDAAKYTKRGVAYFILFLILYVIGENLLKGTNFIYSKAFPTPPEPPNVAFGKIVQLKIQTLPIDLTNVTYRKSLPSLDFPQFPKHIRVYKIETPIISPEKEENFKKRALNLGFESKARKISDTKRIWVNNNLSKQFEAEIYFQTFNLSTNTNYLEANLKPGSSPNGYNAVSETKKMLISTTNLETLFKNADYSIKGVYIQEGLIKETLLPDREILKFVNVIPKEIAYVTYTQSKYDKKKFEESPTFYNIVGKNPLISNINTYVGRDFTITNSSINKSVVHIANFNYYKHSQKYGIYPIIPIQDAWEILINNRASLVYIKEDGADFFAPSENIKEITTIDINDIKINYYMDVKYLEYLQPIYVFRGKFTTLTGRKGTVYFYIPAIDRQLNID